MTWVTIHNPKTNNMFDLKVINSVLLEMEEERGIPKERMMEAIEQALATAYKKEFGKRGQIVRASFDISTGTVNFEQVKIVVDESMLKPEGEEDELEPEVEEAVVPSEEKQVRFDSEKHIMVDTARLIKKDVVPGEELIFPLEPKDDFGRIAAQTAKQVIIQKVREAEKDAALSEFGQKEGDIVTGHVQRFERGNLFVDLGRITAIIPYEEQIPGERFRPGERVRALLLRVEETPRGVFIRLSRSHPEFLTALFAIEAPELQSGSIEIKAVAREAGSRSKIAVASKDPHLDPVGSLVGQRGVRVSTVMSELGGEKIDIIEWSNNITEFIEDSLSPARVLSVRIESEPTEEGAHGHASVEVAPDQQSLAIGRGGQNVRLAAKLTGWKIDIVSQKGEELAEADSEVAKEEPAEISESAEIESPEQGPEVATEAEVEDAATTDRDSLDLDEADKVDTPEEAEENLS
jgi:N utilization substance protein A